MSDTIDVLLVACGATEWDAARRVLGAADVPLSSEGRERVLKGLEALGPIDPSVVVCGPDEASRETAALVAQRGGARVRTAAAIAEPGVGLWEGMGTDQLAEKCTHAFETWLDDPALVVPPQGEPLADAEHRVLAGLAGALEKIKPAQRGGIPRVALVLRPMALGILRCWQESAPTDRLWELSRTHAQQPGGMAWVTLDRALLRRAGQGLRASA